MNCFGSGWLMPLRDEGRVEHLRARSQRGVEGLSVRAQVSAAILRRRNAGRLSTGHLQRRTAVFLTQVVGFAAARLQVDLWRNVFTLNYEIVQGSGRTEPSVAQWVPSTPGA